MHQYPLTEEETDDLEIALFMTALPREVQRLSGGAPTANGERFYSWYQQSSTACDTNRKGGNGLDCDMNFENNDSNCQTYENSRKRRSLVENDIGVMSAAFAVNKMVEGGDFFDEENDFLMIQNCANSFPSYAMVDNLGERPPKRFSSSSDISTLPISSSIRSEENDLGQYYSSTTFNYQSHHQDFNNSAISAACAVIVAEEAAKRYDARLCSYSDLSHENSSEFQSNSRKFKRRAGFFVSNIQREQADVLAERIGLSDEVLPEQICLSEMDRSSYLLPKQNVRRSSFSALANLKNDSFTGTNLPQGAGFCSDHHETPLFGTSEVHKFRRSGLHKMQRRAHSLPDPNAISLFSQSFMNENDHFAADVSGSGIASNYANMIEQQYTQSLGSAHAHVPIHAVNNDFLGFHAATTAVRNRAAYFDRDTTSDDFRSHIGFGSLPATATSPPPPFTPFVPFSTDHNTMVASLQVQANQVLNDIAKPTRPIDMTSGLCNLQFSQQNNIVPSNNCSNSQLAPKFYSLDQCHMEENFDGKQPDIVSIQISNTLSEDYEVALLLHEACRKDDLPVIMKILQKFPLSGRWSLGNDGTGDVALHVASKRGNVSSIKLLLNHDPKCALIRNVEGHSALHHAVHEGYLCVVSSLCEVVPSCAMIQCENGNLPLHDAVSVASKHPDTPQSIQALLHAFKNAVFVANDEGFLPIHLAASSGFEVGLRTLLASEFNTIFTKDILDDMLPLDVAVQQLQEYLKDDDVEDDISFDSSSEKNRLIACIEILLSSMEYKRLISSPRENVTGDKPFLPLHSAIDARPQLQTWKTLLAIYEDDHVTDVDLLGRNLAHRICSRPIEKVETDIYIITNLDAWLFGDYDHFGFIPLHLAVLNKNANIAIIQEVAERCTSSYSQEVLPVYSNMYAKFLPVQIAAASGCSLDVISLLMRAHPAAISI